MRGYPEWFFVLGQGEVLGVPTQLWLLARRRSSRAVILGAHDVRPHHLRDRHNETAARFSGLRVDRTKLAIYTLSGLAAALAAVIFVSRVSTTRSDMGTGSSST